MNDEQSFLVELRSAIASGSITLPTLPDVAIKVRDAVDGESASAREIAEIVTTDPSISVRLLQVANSPLYRGRTPIEDVHTAIGRLGTRMVRSLVTSLAMQGLYNAASGALDRRFRKQWEMSVEVAGMSRVLARLQPQLNAEQGMLAGLIHSIGTLPILVYAESIDEVNHDEEQLDTLLERLSPIIGQQILETWDFPSSLVAVARHYNDPNYDGGPMADYVDLVIVARVQTLAGSLDAAALNRWKESASFAKLGLSADIEVIEMAGVAEQLTDVNSLFLH
jgi:HD-like signal output (HDOD) protein